MGVLIKEILRDSITAQSCLSAGDTILKIDNDNVEDILDIMFFSQKDSFTVYFKDKYNNENKCLINNTFDKPLGIECELKKCRECVNNCIFCFVDQMPSGLRKSLYIKDDDFIYSFFYGNFISLTNLSQKNINKIIRQHISPLYVSIHTTNQVLHKKMFRYQHSFDINKTLKKFNKADIEIHAQIVLIPDVNDKEELFKTLNDLLEMENISTIGIVPVGLTKYREGLEPLTKYTKDASERVITEVEFMKTNRKIMNIYIADEFFINAGIPIPDDFYYENYEQLENGVGMVRKSLENFKLLKKKFIRYFANSKDNPVFITSKSGIIAIHQILNELQKSLPQLKFKAIVIDNTLFGSDVTVCGLLCWSDIKSKLNLQIDEYPVLSSAIFNYENKTLDDFHISQIKNELNKKILVIDELFASFQEF
jgi:putative radical SAM enzyme (TIGR03279 family)